MDKDLDKFPKCIFKREKWKTEMHALTKCTLLFNRACKDGIQRLAIRSHVLLQTWLFPSLLCLHGLDFYHSADWNFFFKWADFPGNFQELNDTTNRPSLFKQQRFITPAGSHSDSSLSCLKTKLFECVFQFLSCFRIGL